MKDVVIVSAARTPIGVLQGALSTVSAADLGSLVIKEALHRANISGDMVDETLFGCVLQAGKYQGIARLLLTPVFLQRNLLLLSI